MEKFQDKRGMDNVSILFVASYLSLIGLPHGDPAV